MQQTSGQQKYRTPIGKVKCTTPGITWPSLLWERAADHLAMMQQFNESERWSPVTLRSHQLTQAQLLLRHAYRAVPLYKKRLATAGFSTNATLDEALWARIPILERHELEAAGAHINSRTIPLAHGKTFNQPIGGSTGRPVAVIKTAMLQLMGGGCAAARSHMASTGFIGQILCGT
jgi:phenylacetate-coenzyme A ligase PaaK-like adenylate-forming protein